MKKKIIAIAACVMLAGVVVFVACNKVLESDQPTAAPSTKSAAYFTKTQSMLKKIVAACDKAYQADSITYLAACENNDIQAFYTITNISEKTIKEFDNIAHHELEAFMKDHPNFKPKETPCFSCMKEALPKLAALSSRTSGHLMVTIPTKALSNDSFEKWIECTFFCYQEATYPIICELVSFIDCCDSHYTTLDRSIEYISDIFNSCVKAYQKDSLEFLKICEANDHSAFLKCIGISEEQNLKMGENMRYEVEKFAKEHPELVKEADSPCHSCNKTALSRIANGTQMLAEQPARLAVFDNVEAHLDLRHCAFVCGLGCVEAGPAYPECLAACMIICLAIPE